MKSTILDKPSDSGQASIILSAFGSVASGTPVFALMAKSDSAMNLSFIVALLVSLLALGVGVVKIYKVWSSSIIESARRNETLDEVVHRLEIIEKRQIQIQEEVNRQATILSTKTKDD
jgi:hypothetical protein